MFFGGLPPGMEDHFHDGGGMGRRRGGGAPPDTTALYKQLEIEKSATAAEIKKAFRKLALKKHPDNGGDPGAYWL